MGNADKRSNRGEQEQFLELLSRDDAMQRFWRHEIGDVAPASPHEALVLKAVDAAPQ